VTDRYVENIS